MKIHTQVCGILAAGCALGVALTPRAAAVTDEEFDALKNVVQQLGEKVQKLEQTHEQDQKTHEQDQQQIQQLKEQLGETQKTATDAQQKAEAAAQVQPSSRCRARATRRTTSRWWATRRSSSARWMGSTAGLRWPILRRSSCSGRGDNVLFEAGFDITLQNNAPGTTSGTGGGATTTFDLSFAQLDYLFNDYVTFVGGDMLLPLGTYTERSAGWLNKIPDDPLPRSLLPEQRHRGPVARGGSGGPVRSDRSPIPSYWRQRAGFGGRERERHTMADGNASEPRFGQQCGF